MSTVVRQSVSAGRATCLGRPAGTNLEAAPLRRRLDLTWAIARPAAAAAGLAASSGGPWVWLQVRFPWDGSVETATAAVIDGEHWAWITPDDAGPVSWSLADGLWHAEAPGVARLTVREGANGVEVLYAATTLPERLGLPGGRYELERADLASNE